MQSQRILFIYLSTQIKFNTTATSRPRSIQPIEKSKSVLWLQQAKCAWILTFIILDRIKNKTGIVYNTRYAWQGT